MNRILLIKFDSLGAWIFDKFKDKFPDAYLSIMARNGVYFTNNYAPCTYTHSSVPTTLFGVYPFEHGILTGRTKIAKLKFEGQLITDAMQELGYEVRCFSDIPWVVNGTFGYHVKASHMRDELDLSPKKDKPIFAFLYYWGTHNPYRIDETMLTDEIRDEFKESIDSGNKKRVKEIRNKCFELIFNALNVYSKRLQTYDDGKTWFVICADHGDDLGIHNIPFHDCFPYDTVIKTPLVIYKKGIEPKVEKRIFSNVNISSIILDLVAWDKVLYNLPKDRVYITGTDFKKTNSATINSCGYIDIKNKAKIIYDKSGYEFMFDREGNLEITEKGKEDFPNLSKQYPHIFKESELKCSEDELIKRKLESMGYM